MSEHNMIEKPDKFEVGKRVRRVRESHDFTREQFSEIIDISPQFLAEIENGTKGMSFETLSRICRYYASADYVLFGRQSSELSTPASQALVKMPEKYSEEVSTIMEALLSMANK
ncbi:MAG: helix-turn-helix domain-containing protein [Lachnospiraceae bacterium]